MRPRGHSIAHPGPMDRESGDTNGDRGPTCGESGAHEKDSGTVSSERI